MCVMQAGQNQLADEINRVCIRTDKGVDCRVVTDCNDFIAINRHRRGKLAISVGGIDTAIDEHCIG